MAYDNPKVEKLPHLNGITSKTKQAIDTCTSWKRCLITQARNVLLACFICSCTLFQSVLVGNRPFRITPGLFLEASLGAHPFIYKSIFIQTQIKLIFMSMNIDLHMKR